MRFNIEVELDYINEEGCLDEAIKESILHKITETVMEKVGKEVDAKLDEIVVMAAKEKASKIVDQITEDFVTKEFTKLDPSGDEIETGLTVKALLKREFDAFWKANVDKQGRQSNYGTMKPRIEWKIDALIEKHSKEFAQTLTTDTENKIKNTMRDNLSASIGAKLVSELGFDKMLTARKK